MDPARMYETPHFLSARVHRPRVDSRAQEYLRAKGTSLKRACKHGSVELRFITNASLESNKEGYEASCGSFPERKSDVTAYRDALLIRNTPPL